MDHSNSGMESGSKQHGDVGGQLPMPLSKFQSNVGSSKTLGSTTAGSFQMISEKKKMFEGQEHMLVQHQSLQVKQSLPVTGSSTTGSSSSMKKFFGRSKDTVGHGSFRLKRKQQQEANADHHKVTVEALKETPPLRKRINLRPRRARLRPLVHFDHQSIPIVVGTLPANIIQFEQRGNSKSVTGASAAHATVYEDLATFRDRGDEISNELVLSCPYFRNEIGGEWLGGSNAEAQFRRSLSDDLRGVAASLVEQLVYEGAQMVGRDELLMNLRNTTVHSPKLSETLASDQISLDSFSYFEENRKPLEYVDYGALYYRTYFADKEHSNFFGVDDIYGPVAISLRRERMDEDTSPVTIAAGSTGTLQSKYLYRIIVRTCQSQTIRGSIPEDAIPASSKPSSAKGLPPKDIIEHVCPEFTLSCLRVAKQDKKVQDELMRLDEQELNNMYKIGLLYCKNGQSLEEEMYNNAMASPELEEFLEFIGEKVRMKGFEGYRAQLDNKTDTTGEHSIYTQYNNCEIMFHVSTLLPYQDNHKQQLLRKRHIGNDIVTVIFQDPEAKPFCAKNIRSQFQHVFIVVRCLPASIDKPVQYKVSVTRSYDVPFFGPPIPKEAVFDKNEEFRNFLLAKLINAENAGHHSKKFNTMATRTRRQYLLDLANSYSSSQSIEQVNVSRFDGILVKKKRKTHNVPMQSMFTMKGAIAWTVSVLLKNEKPLSMTEEPDAVIDCYLAISLDSLVLICDQGKELLVHIPTSYIISWYQDNNRIMLFYGGGHVICLEVCPQLDDPSDDVTDHCRDIVKRLQNVNPTIVEADFLNLFRQGGRLGFTIERDGFVSGVLEHAMDNGLQPGCRIVQVENIFVSSSSHEDILVILKSRIDPVRVIAIPQTRRSTSHTHYRPYVMLREQIDWPTVWSLRPTSMDGGSRSRTSSAQTPEHRRPGDPVTIGELHVSKEANFTGSSISKLKLPEKRKVSKRPYSYIAAMESPNDPMVDVMQTITEPTTGDDMLSDTASGTLGNDNGQDHTTKHGQDGLTGHFKKRKPMKTTSRTSINNLVDNKTEYDPEYDRQSPSPEERIPRVTGSLKLAQPSHYNSPRPSREASSSTSGNMTNDAAKNRASSEEVFQQFMTCSEPTSPLRTSMQQQQHKLGQPSSFLSTSWERGKVNQLVKRYSSSSSNSSQTPRGSHSDVRLKRSGSEDSSTIPPGGLSTSNSAPNNISVEVGGRPRSWVGDTRESSRSPLDHYGGDLQSSNVTGSRHYQRRTPPISLLHSDPTPGDTTPTGEEFVRKSHERVAMRRKRSETVSSPPTPGNPVTVEQGYGLEDDNALSLKKMSVKDRTATWERRQQVASAGAGYDTLKRLGSTSSRLGSRDSPARQIPSLQRNARGRSESFSDMDPDGHIGGKSKSPNPTASHTTYHSYTLPKASMSSSKPPLPYSSPGKLHTNRASDRTFSSSENLAKHISEQLKLPPSVAAMSSSISEEPDEDDETDGGKTATRRASAEARMTKTSTTSGIPVMSTTRSVTPNPPSKTTIHEESSPHKSSGSRSQKTTSGIPVSSRRTPSPLIDNRNNGTVTSDKSKPTDTPTTDSTSSKRSTIPRVSGPSSSSSGHGNSHHRRSSADQHIPNKGSANNSSKTMPSSSRSNSDVSQQQQMMSLAARRLQKASSLTNVNNDPSDNSSPSKLKAPHSGGSSNIPRPTTGCRLHPLVIKTPQAMISDGCAPITIEELVSSPRILPHQQHNKLPPQASFPLKTSSSTSKHHELKVSLMTSLEHTPAKNTAVTKSMSSTTTVMATSKVTCDDAAGENGEPGQVGGVGLTSERPGSAHDGSETDSQPEYVPTDDEEDEGSSHLGSGDYPELIDLQAEVSKLKLDLEKERDDKEELEEVVKLLQKENKILRGTKH